MGIKIKDNTQRVDQPSHYDWFTSKYGCSPHVICEGFGFMLGNAFKYMVRAGRKREAGYSQTQKTIEDLEKAKWYIEHKIQELQNDQLTKQQND